MYIYRIVSVESYDSIPVEKRINLSFVQNPQKLSRNKTTTVQRLEQPEAVVAFPFFLSFVF